MEVSIGNLELSLQKSLLGNVFPNLRAVCVNLEDHLIQIHFYHDNNISDKDLSLCKHALNQTIADFSPHPQNGPPIQFDTKVVQVDFPKKMPIIGYWVFYRQEDTIQYID